MLEISGLSKEYPTPRGPLHLLENVSLSLARGEAAAIMGPSGSGKSTLLYILGTLEPPTAGDVVLDGCHPFQLAERDLARFRNRHIGFIFQDHCLLPQCSVLENVLAPTLIEKSAEDYRRRALELLDQVGLKDRIDHRPAELSGGEKQRVAMARAMVRYPSLLLCDEPTGNLDSRSAGSVADLLVEQHRRHGSILLVVTHSPTLAARFPLQYRLTDRQLHRVQPGPPPHSTGDAYGGKDVME